MTYWIQLYAYWGICMLFWSSADVFKINLCRLLITFPNSLGPDQDRQNVGPDLDPNRLTL